MVAIGPVVSEEKLFEIVDGRRTDDGRRTTEPAYTISSPGAFGSGELKMYSKDAEGMADSVDPDQTALRGEFDLGLLVCDVLSVPVPKMFTVQSRAGTIHPCIR